MLLSSLFANKQYPSGSGYRPIYAGLGLTDLNPSKIVVTDPDKWLASGTYSEQDILNRAAALGTL